MDGPNFGVHVAVAIQWIFQRRPRRRQEYPSLIHGLLDLPRLGRNVGMMESNSLVDMIDT